MSDEVLLGSLPMEDRDLIVILSLKIVGVNRANHHIASAVVIKNLSNISKNLNSVKIVVM